MHRHGLKTGVLLNAFHDVHDSTINCSRSPPECSRSAAQRTLRFTEGYVRLAGRMSEHAVLEQWQPFPSATGPAATKDTGMWMASACAAVVNNANQ